MSDIVEPMVGNIEGGTEIISTEDMVGNLVELNVGMDGWNEGHAWDGVEECGWIACGTCTGDEGKTVDEARPEWCMCEVRRAPCKYRVRSNCVDGELKGTQQTENNSSKEHTGWEGEKPIIWEAREGEKECVQSMEVLENDGIKGTQSVVDVTGIVENMNTLILEEESLKGEVDGIVPVLWCRS